MGNIAKQKTTEEEFRSIFEMSLDLICVADLHAATFIKINPSFSQVLGYTEEEFLNRSFLDFIHPEDVQPTVKVIEHSLKLGKKVLKFENRYRTKTGQYRWFSWTAHPNVDCGLTYAIARDITESKHVESLLAGEKRILENIATSKSRDGGLTELVKIIESLSDGMICSILLLDNDGMHLRHGASVSLPDEYNQAIDGMKIGPKEGSCGTAAWLNQTVIVTDIASDPLWKDYHDLALKHNLRACWSIPIHASTGKVLGTFAMYYDQPRSPDNYHENLIDRAVHLASIAIVKKRTEGDLRQYEHIVSSSTDMLALLDKDFIFLAANEAYRKAFRFSPKDPIGKTAADVFGQQRFESVIKPAAQRCLSGETVNFQDWIDYPAFGSMYMDVSYYPYFDHDNQVKGFVVNGRDITKQKRASDQLKETNMALSNAMPGISRLDTDGCYIEVNDYYAQVLGYEPEELLGGTWGKTVHPDDISIAQTAYEKMRKERKSEFEARAVRKDGSIFHKALLMVRIDAQDGKMLGHHCFMRDITERKQAEEEIRRQKDKLAHISRVSTMGEMATGLAHEVNQPLAAIANYCYAGTHLLDNIHSADVEPLRELFEKLSDESLRAGEIIRRLRGLVCKRAPVRVKTDVHEPIQEVIRLLENDLRQSEVRIKENTRNDLPAVMIDDVQIQQVVVNLVRNAIDAMSDVECDRRSLTITTLLNKDEFIEIAISDTGKGLPPESVDRVFDAFYSSKPEGMGMGLAISRSIIESHGGKMWITANSGPGVTFHFTLPIEKEEGN